LIAILVVVAVVAPVIGYFADGDADDEAMRRFYCPEFNFNFSGGAQFPTQGASGVSALGITRVRASAGYLGLMAEMNVSSFPDTVAGGFAAHFWVRAKPKQHVEMSVALGFRRQVGYQSVLNGLEVAVPSMFVFSRQVNRLGLQLTPRVLFHSHGIEPGVETALIVPATKLLQLQLSAGAFSHLDQIWVSTFLGVSLNL
jgi:hypothetical protein